MEAKEDIYSLTPEEVEIMRASESDPNIFFAYWFEKPGIEPFQLDRNFTEEAKWQWKFCMALQSMIVAICGIATGKTVACGASAFYHACITPYFKFLNIGHELLQAKFMFDAIMQLVEGTRAEKLIVNAPTSPFPRIFIKYMIDGVIISSELAFMSAGEKSDAKNLLSYRGDWINIEEAGRFQNLSGVVSLLTTRLTGSTPAGRPYMGRLSLISNPIDNPELWTIFEKARTNPSALTIMIDTAQNKNVTPEQLQMQLDNIPEEEQAFYLTGARPEGVGVCFNRNAVDACTNQILTSKLRKGLAAQLPGFVGHHYPALGYWHYEFPWEADHQYIMVGDPGTGAAPMRNAPAIFVIDTTEAPRMNIISAMWWGNGGGKIAPFYDMYLYMLEKYKPIFAGVDSTSNQKSTAEIINMDYIYEAGYSVDKIEGLDFSGARRMMYINSARASLESRVWAWPDEAKGIAAQLKAYDHIEDRLTTSKLAQDLVCCFSMGAFASRWKYPPEPPKPPQDEQHVSSVNNFRNGIGRRVILRNPTARIQTELSRLLEKLLQGQSTKFEVNYGIF